MDDGTGIKPQKELLKSDLSSTEPFSTAAEQRQLQQQSSGNQGGLRLQQKDYTGQLFIDNFCFGKKKREKIKHYTFVVFLCR